ncbi:MAG: radical SAM protein [Deltaproteobacteria bacterium]|nr:radical SAM protein [Deltaproteobacteria bacterium]
MSYLDVALIKPGSQRQLYGELSDFSLTGIEPPLWAALLAAYLRQEGFGVALLDAEVEGLDYASTAARIADANPRLAVVTVSGTNPSASTMNMTGAREILKSLKERDPAIRTVLTGIHPSALPTRTLREEPVDFVCQGEGFHALAKLIECLRSGGEARGIPGLWYRDGEEILSGGAAPLMSDLDALPMPAWDLLPIERYRAHNWHCFDRIEERQPYAVIYTSLGCPFKCTFCCINALFGKSGIRYRSPQTVIEEIDYLVSTRGVRNIKIVDEMFALKKTHVHQLCDLIIERGYDLNIWAYARVNTVNREMLAKMKRAGINWIAYGFESASERVLNDVSKGYRPEKSFQVARITHEEGLHICANFIFGLPEDDRESMQQTLDMAKEIGGEWANLYSTMAYPGSHLYEQAMEQGSTLPDTWQGYSQYAYESLPLSTKHLSGSEVLAFRDDAFHSYHSNPRYLAMIEHKFGAEVVRHIKEMCVTRLRRKWSA